eukprot:TRINITY_DN4870_c1_g1_i1.p1 TRINITY_DN4870_c1_g1~~TRINITY_DN4870_c1_g1_i1.p1  ORF type:complete len:228 (-),score=14.54 TRINITY_DN4870_c1_g1_i1:71-754(-)
MNTHVFAIIAGYLSTACFTFQYLPQAWLNFKRKSVRGFSTSGIIIKHIGASFLFVNSWLNGENYPVILYGLLNVCQHSGFLAQFSIYPSEDKVGSKDSKDSKDIKAENHDPMQGREKFLWWLIFPLLPYVLGIYLPDSITFTNYVKPITQIMSHIPQLKVCYDLKSTSGVAMLSQHLNLIGGLFGLYMCIINPPKTPTTYLIYLNSCFQALSLYAMALYYKRVTSTA